MTFLTTTARAMGRIVRGLAAATILAVLLIGIPVALTKFIGWPLPDHLPDVAELGDRLNQPYNDTTFLLNALAVALWLAWTRFAYGVTVEAIVAIRHGAAYRPSLDWHSAPVRGAAAVLIGAIMGALLFDLARGMVAGHPASAAGPAAAKPAVATAVHDTPTVALPRPAHSPQVTQHSAARVNAPAGNADTYRVCKGDTLWDIAADRLGDPHQWRSIWTLNRGTVFPDGRTFTRPDRIHTGWELKLPPTAAPAPAPAVRPEPPQGYLDRHAHDGDETPVPPQQPAELPADDGVSIPSRPPTAGQHTQQTPAADTQVGQNTSEHGISLPSGSWIGVGLAAAVALAGRLVWVQRRRRYRPQPPSPDLRLTDSDTAPLPPVVRHVQRRLDTTLQRPAPAASSNPGPTVPTPAAPSWTEHDPILTGPDAARAVLIQALAAGGHDLDERGHVVIPAATLAALLPEHDVRRLPATPRLIITDSLGAALDWCEEQLLFRRRILISHEADTAAELRDSDPLAEPMPPITLIAAAPDDTHQVRASAILSQGVSVNMSATLLGADDEITPGTGATVPSAAVGSLTADETAAMLHTVAESHTGFTPHPLEPTSGADEANPTDDAADAGTVPSDNGEPGDEPADSEPDGGPDGEGEELSTDDATAATDNDDIPVTRVRITVLGGVTIHNPDNRVVEPPIRRPSHELAAYLIANGGEARQTAILEDLLPDAPAKRAPGRLDTIVYSLRLGLKQIGGKQLYLDHPRHRYVLNPDALDVDLWHLRDALTRAQAARSRDERIQALQEAISYYTGPFAGDLPYDWKNTYVFAVSRQVLDARIALAEALERDSPHDALDVLRAAIAQEPQAEEPYRRAMDIHARLGDADAIRDLRRAITRVLEEDEIDVSNDLLAHAEDLIMQITKKRPARTG